MVSHMVYYTSIYMFDTHDEVISSAYMCNAWARVCVRIIENTGRIVRNRSRANVRVICVHRAIVRHLYKYRIN